MAGFRQGTRSSLRDTKLRKWSRDGSRMRHASFAAVEMQAIHEWGAGRRRGSQANQRKGCCAILSKNTCIEMAAF